MTFELLAIYNNLQKLLFQCYKLKKYGSQMKQKQNFQFLLTKIYKKTNKSNIHLSFPSKNKKKTTQI